MTTFKSAAITFIGKLPSQNEYVDACRRNPHVGAKMKRDVEDRLRWQIKAQLRGEHFTAPVMIAYTWYEENRRRDHDNVAAFGMKVIQDSLVAEGIIAGDGWRGVKGFSHLFEIDKNNPRVDVVIQEVEQLGVV